MSGDQKMWSAFAVLLCLTVVACTMIMAQCTIKTDNAQAEAAQCTAHGGLWHTSSDPTQRFCEEQKK